MPFRSRLNGCDAEVVAQRGAELVEFVVQVIVGAGIVVVDEVEIEAGALILRADAAVVVELDARVVVVGEINVRSPDAERQEDRRSTRLNSSNQCASRMPSAA